MKSSELKKMYNEEFMTVDLSFSEFLKSWKEQPDFYELSPSENRHRIQTMYKKPEYEAFLASVSSLDKKINVNKTELPIRIYRPNQECLPCLVWFHGGGFLFGDLDSNDPICRQISKTANIVIISVHYRLAPENKFPSAPEDCYHSLKWVIKNANNLNINSDGVFIGGASAGATLAAATCLMMRDRKIDSAIKHQLLIKPLLNEITRNNSYDKFGENHFLTTKSINYFLNHYIENNSDLQNPYCLPGKTENVENLPPAMIITAECDPLCDEGEHYASRLKMSGNKTLYKCYQGLIHGFLGQSLSNKVAKNAVDDIVNNYTAAIQKLV